MKNECVFLHNRSVRILAQVTKPIFFKWHTLVQVKGFQLNLYEKLNFFGENWIPTSTSLNTKCGYLHFLKVGNQNDKFQQIQFQSKSLFSGPGETKTVKTTDDKMFSKKILIFLITLFNRTIPFCRLLKQLDFSLIFWKIFRQKRFFQQLCGRMDNFWDEVAVIRKP